MDSVLQYIFITLVLSLMCTCTFATPDTEQMNAKIRFDKCEFDPTFEYNTTSEFKVNAFNQLSPKIQLTYYFDVRKQTIDLRRKMRGPLLARFDYKTHTVYIPLGPSDYEDITIVLEKSLKLPSTFPADDTKPCGVNYHDGSEVFAYYSKEYDFWFSIKETSPGKCQMHEISLPGQPNPKGTCLLRNGT